MIERIVLCVDDEAIILLALQHRLRAALGEGYRCETARSGKDALEYLEGLEASGKELSAVVSDWRMPDMNGDAFLRKVREVRPKARLILLTGYADREQVGSLESEIGLLATFQKPCDTALLARAILADA